MGTRKRPGGWHQLDSSWAERLVTEARVGPGDLVLDLGAGRGRITEHLVDTGARVIAVELHSARADALRGRYGESVTVVQTDVADLSLPRRPFTVVSNPPFNETSAILHRLLQHGSRLRSAHLLLQRQAVDRWTSTSAPGLTRLGHQFTARPGTRVPRSAFSPRPNVDAQVLVLQRRHRQ